MVVVGDGAVQFSLGLIEVGDGAVLIALGLFGKATVVVGTGVFRIEFMAQLKSAMAPS